MKNWPETPSLGGEMYALRDLKAAKNNCLPYMRQQRADGRDARPEYQDDGKQPARDA